MVSPSQVTGESDEGELFFGQRQLQLHPFPTFYFFFLTSIYQLQSSETNEGFNHHQLLFSIVRLDRDED